MKIRAFGMASLALLALAGCSKGGDDPAGKAGGWAIEAGRYSNGAGKDAIKLELDLADGDRSQKAAVRVCEADCVDFADVPLMRGLNGVSFALSYRGKMVDVTVTPVSQKAVLVSGNWGPEMTASRLDKLP